MPDPIIIGAGIQGASLALAAVARGTRPIVIDQNPHPSGASINSYGIIHGGLRYLQSFNLARWNESRQAQSWYIDRFPRHIRPLRCVMPLYRRTMRSPALFAAARSLDRSLRLALGRRVPLPPDGACDREALLDGYPIARDGLIGGAIWHDAYIVDPSALLTEMLAQVEARGGTVLRSTRATALAMQGTNLRGLHLCDIETGREHRLAAEQIFDCTGSSAGALLARQTHRSLPTAATLAFNLLLDIPAPPDRDAYALSPSAGSGRSYFFRQVAGGTLAGTFYRAAPGAMDAQPHQQDVERALLTVAQCLPSLRISMSKVLAVHAGLLPDQDGTGAHLMTSDRHLQPGPSGYHLLLGGKLTTAPLLSQRAARAIRCASVDQIGDRLENRHA